MPSLLETVAGLSREFGGPDYVRGGGGNTSAKNIDTLWVKPSGTTLAEMKPETFVAMDRERISRLYTETPPAEAAAREALVKTRMAEAVRPGSSGRPSVEAPLHNAFSFTYVVHTHPAIVNAMTCARQGEDVCRRRFPEALWIPYTDPGYTLCMKVRNACRDWEKTRGREPRVVFLENHGIFVGGSAPEEIRETMAGTIAELSGLLAAAGIPVELPIQPGPDPETAERTRRRLRDLLGADAAQAVFTGRFETPGGPISPDHIVYAKSYVYDGPLEEEPINEFRKNRGYAPRVVRTRDSVWGLGDTKRNAELALEFALDGAQVQHYARAFGGIQYLDAAARDFIENWEVESYRRSVALRGSEA
ncbi:MAG: class II aldolase/adducin family protein [Kiritimatiellia bacterium]|nr:class II aldolase/adducin family protein [Kiritimatiellia bacterium]